jgi:hypothetical protein
LPAFGIAEKEGSWEEGIGTNQGEGYVCASRVSLKILMA